MRNLFVTLALILSLVFTGCSGGVDSDLKKTPEEVRKSAESMSTADLEKRVEDLKKRAEELTKSVGTNKPSDAQMTEMTKLIEVAGIYTMELVKKKMK